MANIDDDQDWGQEDPDNRETDGFESIGDAMDGTMKEIEEKVNDPEYKEKVQRNLEKQEEERKKRIQEYLKKEEYLEVMMRESKMNIPPNYRSANAERFKKPPYTESETEPPIKRIEDWYKDDSAPWLFIYGSTNTGKGYFSAYLAKRFCRDKAHRLAKSDEISTDRLLANRWEPGPYFQGVSNLITRIKDTYSRQAEEQKQDIVQEMTNKDILILDDLGAENITDESINTIYNILENREYVQESKRTIITSNLSLKIVDKKLDPRIASRITRNGPTMEFSYDTLNQGQVEEI